MEIIILYETCEGQTRRIVHAIATQAGELGHSVTMIDTSDTRAALSLETADKVILAAPVHERRHPKTFELAIMSASQVLSQRPTLMLSVSLKAAFPDWQEEAQDYLTEMEMRTGFQPTREALVAGAVRNASYDYFQSQIVNHVVLAGRGVELTDGVREFTDWTALEDTVRSFLES